jgi:hypothetical protein
MNNLKAFATNPIVYVAGFYMGGAASIVAGVAVVSSIGWALVASGAFMICAAGFIRKGLKPNG